MTTSDLLVQVEAAYWPGPTPNWRRSRKPRSAGDHLRRPAHGRDHLPAACCSTGSPNPE